MPLTIYFDDSGTDPKQPVANATGLIIPAERILQMEREWNTLKLKEEFSDFHTSEFVYRNKKSEYANWEDIKQKRVFSRVCQITRKYGVQVFSFSVKKDDYDECVPLEIREYAGDSHYTWAIRQASMFAQLWKSDKGITEPYEWTFDWMEKHDESRKEIEEIFEQMEYLTRVQRGLEHEYTHIDFRERSTLAGLQCVDLLAWTNYNVSLEQWKYLPRPLHPFAQEAWGSFASMPKCSSPSITKLFRESSEPIDWNSPIVLTRQQLEGWVKDELSTGRSLQYVKQWEAHKKATMG